ncbi:MAG: hypothetical protein JEZ07_17635, partial [Phycisphaerae bacterium]|nr:hypothetical protein [Phycisphaerae bacterium]
ENKRWQDERTLEFSASRSSVSATQPDNPDLEYMIRGYGVKLPRN